MNFQVLATRPHRSRPGIRNEDSLARSDVSPQPLSKHASVTRLTQRRTEKSIPPQGKRRLPALIVAENSCLNEDGRFKHKELLLTGSVHSRPALEQAFLYKSRSTSRRSSLRLILSCESPNLDKM